MILVTVRSNTFNCIVFNEGRLLKRLEYKQIEYVLTESNDEKIKLRIIIYIVLIVIYINLNERN